MAGTSLWTTMRYDLNRVIATRDDLFEKIFGRYLGSRPEGDDFVTLVNALADYLKVTDSVILESIRTVAGQRMTQQLALKTAWRLAGNVKRLRAGRFVPPWVHQYEPEVVPVQAISCEFQRTKRQRPMFVFQLRVMAGTPAPMLLSAWWSRSFCYILARRIGYTSRRGSFPFSDPRELVNMRLLVLLDPSKTRDGRPGFCEVRCSAGLKRWNRSIIEKRFRRQGHNHWPCPYGFDHYCYQCPIGYVDCEAATHRLTTIKEQPVDSQSQQKQLADTSKDAG